MEKINSVKTGKAVSTLLQMYILLVLFIQTVFFLPKWNITAQGSLLISYLDLREMYTQCLTYPGITAKKTLKTAFKKVYIMYEGKPGNCLML